MAAIYGKPFSIYFPQYYPIPVNDDAWGKGFTDWSLVANANMRDWWIGVLPRGASTTARHPRFTGRRSGGAAAGLGGFGVYHYWFYSHQELGAFEQTLLHSSTISMPWFLIWASGDGHEGGSAIRHNSLTLRQNPARAPSNCM